MKTDNELVAEFMGGQPDSKGTFYYFPLPTNKGWRTEKLAYHTSWDWLMPVVEKIEKMYSEEVDQFNKPLGEQALADVEYSKILCLNITAGIEITYKAVVEFIKWYRSQPEGNTANNKQQ